MTTDPDYEVLEVRVEQLNMALAAYQLDYIKLGRQIKRAAIQLDDKNGRRARIGDLIDDIISELELAEAQLANSNAFNEGE